MTPEELHDEWTAGDETGVRPRRVQVLRDDLARVTGLHIPRRIPEIEAMLDNPQRRGAITRELTAAVDPDDGEADEEDA